MFHVKHRTKAVLFDYNGTLFFDSDINRIAWKQTMDEMSGGTLDFDSVYASVKAARNCFLVNNIFEAMDRQPSEEEVDYWVRRKETHYYQPYCLDHGRNQMSPGSEELLNYLKENGYPVNLCTASIKENVDFYFDLLNLERWFDMDKVAYDDGTFYDKTTMYRACAERVGADIKDCIVIEDTMASIRQAINAGAERIIAIRKEDTVKLDEIIQIVDDLSEVDLSLFD